MITMVMLMHIMLVVIDPLGCGLVFVLRMMIMILLD